MPNGIAIWTASTSSSVHDESSDKRDWAMIIACPNCHTRYRVPDGKIPPKGRKAKCSKCGEIFKATPPPPTPEDEVPSLLSVPASDPATAKQPAADDFGGAVKKAEAEKAPNDSIPGGQGKSPTQGDEPGDFGGILDEKNQNPDSSSSLSGKLDAPVGEAVEEPSEVLGDRDEKTEKDKQDDQTFAGEPLSPLGGEDGLGLDDKKGNEAMGQKRTGPVLLSVAFLILIFVVAVVTYNFGLWNERDCIKEPPAFQLPFHLPFKVPFLRGPEAEPPQGAESEESFTERVQLIQPIDFRQYNITNEKVGPIFVVEGKALNRFKTPKSRIQVLVTLYDKAGNVLAQKEQLCGNTLSLFQLQVQSKQEIIDALNSKAGIYANNAFIKPGDTSPFMVVFFIPPDDVEEYQIKIVDSCDPPSN